ncbi:hypothetical protein BDA96_06G114700 [Sorghum bicolor]|uniref:Uncharacterized protein n=2 Tax=Sorghum bicolor TaxID=4558 RepID=A0A921QS16_SORBI|nr:hypothetical protein BDA96_06G114700 [Sorghum bicolor]KXG26449.1 hypothetical protein SORBI_3006G103800 [Sorghum bicolor]
MEAPPPPLGLASQPPTTIKVFNKTSTSKPDTAHHTRWEIHVLSHPVHLHLPSLLGLTETDNHLAWTIHYCTGDNHHRSNGAPTTLAPAATPTTPAPAAMPLDTLLAPATVAPATLAPDATLTTAKVRPQGYRPTLGDSHTKPPSPSPALAPVPTAQTTRTCSPRS